MRLILRGLARRRSQLLVAAAVAAFSLTGTATAAARPSPLYSTAGGWSCVNGAFNTSGDSWGTVAIRVDETETSATVTVRLRDAAPNTTYALFVMESVGTGCSIPRSFAALTTNDQGAGAVRMTVTVEPNATSRNLLVESSNQPMFASAF